MTNEVLQTIKSRRTVRAYRPDAVPEELLQAVLKAEQSLLLENVMEIYGDRAQTRIF